MIKYIGHIRKKKFDLQFQKVKSPSWWGYMVAKGNIVSGAEKSELTS